MRRDAPEPPESRLRPVQQGSSLPAENLWKPRTPGWYKSWFFVQVFIVVPDQYHYCTVRGAKEEATSEDALEAVELEVPPGRVLTRDWQGENLSKVQVCPCRKSQIQVESGGADESRVITTPGTALSARHSVTAS
eukprot:705118-Rhodomonas_salina.1